VGTVDRDDQARAIWRDVYRSLSEGKPRFRIYAEAEKAYKDRLLPMTPDFAKWLAQTAEAERTGRVFKLNGLRTGRPITAKRVSRIVSKIGRKAGVVVNAEGKSASAHDFRRSFGTRWAKRVRPPVLQQLMPHESIESTLTYYVALDVEDVADELWAAHESSGFGNSLGNIGQIGGQETETGSPEQSTEPDRCFHVRSGGHGTRTRNPGQGAPHFQ
jgi:integrase